MQGRDPVVIGPARHQVAEINHDAVGHNRYVYPGPGLGVDLQPTRFILRLEDRQTPIIAVGPGPELPWLRWHLRSRVVPHAQAADMFVDLIIEKRLWLVER